MAGFAKSDTSLASRLVSLAAWLLVPAAYFVGLNLPLMGPDEPRYAQVAREMLSRGDWVTPTLGGHTWFEKPALLYWFEMLGYKAFGVTEFAARLGPALSGLGIAACVYLLFRFLNSAEMDRSFARRAALIAASTVGIAAFAHGASFDIILTFPLTAALVCYYLYESGRGPAAAIGAYFFIGVSLLAKGLIGVVFPAAIIAFYHVLIWRMPRRRVVISLVWGIPLALATAAIWYVPVYLQNGYAFFDEFIIQHHFQRFTSNKFQHPQPFWFFFWVLPMLSIPWLPFWLAEAWRAAKELYTRISSTGLPARTPNESVSLFALAWLLVPLVFFTFSGSKLPGYILPSVPAAAILAAVAAERLLVRKIWIDAISAATLTIIVGLLIFYMPGFAAGDSVKGLIAAADENGFAQAKVIGFHTVSHNAEFYAAGRLVRDADGKQRRFAESSDVLAYLRADPKPVLVLVPTKLIGELNSFGDKNIRVIADNGDTAIAALTPAPDASPASGTPDPIH